MGRGQGMELEQDKAMRGNRDRPRNAGSSRSWPRRAKQGEAEGGDPRTLQAAQDSGVLPASPPPPTGRVKAGWGPFSQFKQLPLITPLTGAGEGGGGGKHTGVELLVQRLSKASGLWPGSIRIGRGRSKTWGALIKSQKSPRWEEEDRAKGQGSQAFSFRQSCQPRQQSPWQAWGCSR